jgi:hypothetical protein
MQKKNIFFMSVLFVMLIVLGGCSSNLTGYYKNLRAKIDSGDYEGVVKFIDKSKNKYGSKNILMYYLDSGIVTHFASDYETSLKRFESAKKIGEYFQKSSISVDGASMIFNNTVMPYFSEDFEKVHISVFEALDYILLGRDNEAVVEARQADTLFKTFETEKNYKNFYKDDGFIRYFMGIVYENAGYINDAHISYYRALKAYTNGISGVVLPKDLIDDTYTSALILGMEDRAAEIKKEYQQAHKREIPDSYGECIVICYSGFIPEKIDNVLEFALFDLWTYVGSAAEVSSEEQEKFNKAKSIDFSIFAQDYVKVAFPKYKDFRNRVFVFEVKSDKQEVKSVLVQNLGEVAKKCLDAKIKNIYARTLARATVKYIIGKSVSKGIEKNIGDCWSVLSQSSFNMYNSLSETSDRRAWNTLPEKILMARLCLPEGRHIIKVNFLDKHGKILQSSDVEVNIKAEKKNFVILRNS